MKPCPEGPEPPVDQGMYGRDYGFVLYSAHTVPHTNPHITAMLHRLPLTLIAALSIAPAFAQFCDTEVSPSTPVFDSRFGTSLCVQGDLAIVGAPSEGAGFICQSGVNSGGAAYIYELQNGSWVETARFISPNGECEGEFGYDVAISGTFAVVGAPFEDVNGVTDAGRAYLFQNVGGTWSYAGVVEELTTYAGSRFGHSVDLVGGAMAVGAISSDFFGPSAGAVYLYRHQSGQWIFEDRVGPSPIEPGGFFGTSVAISNGLCAVGAVYDSNLAFQEGAAYVFARQPNTTWIEDVKLVPPTLFAQSFYGIAVDLVGSRMVVGAEGIADGASNSGTAYGYFRSAPGLWSPAYQLHPPTPVANGTYGRAVTITHERIVVSDISAPGGGAAYVFDLVIPGPPAWTHASTVTGINAVISDAFPTDISLSGGTLLSGAPLRTTAIPLAGAAFLHDLDFADCNNNGTNDECELLQSPGIDCDSNGLIDTCEIANDPTLDCDANGRLDVCDIALDPLLDCDGNGLIDLCEIAMNTSLDCNLNTILDICDIANGTSSDINGNGIPDSCESVGTNTGCQNVPNSTGSVAGLAGVGSPFLAANDIVLITSGIPLNTFGFPILSRTATSTIPGNSSGFRCVGGSVGRDYSNIFNTGTTGTALIPIDSMALPQPNGTQAAVAGETWYFQVWHRDSIAGNLTSTFSDSLEITFL